MVLETYSKLPLEQACPNYGLTFDKYWPAQKSENVLVYHIFLYILSIFASVEEMITIIPKHSITATIEVNAIGIIYIVKLEVHIVPTYHCDTYTLWRGPLLITVLDQWRS